MPSEKTIGLQVKLNFTDKGDVPPLQAYAFTNQGKLLGSAPVEKGAAVVQVPIDLDGRMIEVIFGPLIEKGQPEPSSVSLKRAGSHANSVRFLAKTPSLELKIPGIIFPKWCLCLVRGRLMKRVTLPDGTIKEQPICNARVHICEVDRIRWVIERLPDLDILRLREDLLRKLRVIPGPRPPRPEPDPGPLKRLIKKPIESGESLATILSPVQQQTVAKLALSKEVAQFRSHLTDLSSLIGIYLCDLIYLWPFFKLDCLTTVEVDHGGRFSTTIVHDCKDQPDMYLWVEQFQDGAWHTVYRPSIGCGTYWNYVCSTEIVLNLPQAIGCEEPTYDIPPGVTQFVLPYAIASTPIWGTPLGSPPAPDGWVRADGFLNYQSGSSLGWLYDAPFGGTLNFIHDDSYFIPSSNIRYYRYSYRRVNMAANTGASDPTWTPIMAPQARGYRMEYSDRLPTYEAYPVNPVTIGLYSGLFEFKPQLPPVRPTDPPTVVVREWTSGNLSEVAASWNTLLPVPPLSTDNTIDTAGDFEIKIEVFDPAGNQVFPGTTTFRFLARNADGTTTRLSTPAEEAGGAYVFRVHVDNNYVTAELPQPSVNGVAASDDCGFLRYQSADSVHVQYVAAHPNNHAVFGFGITRGSNGMPSASTLDPYVEVAAANAPTTTTPYLKVSDVYQRDFTPMELVGTCVNAAFAASLGVYGKATNGDHRLGLDASRLIAFALAEEEIAPDV